MRPVNLIPPEDRRGGRAPLRSGPLSYVLVGGLAVVLIAVTALVLSSNDIAEKEAEIAQLELDRDAATAEAAELSPYAEFELLQRSRRLTVAGLAQSRFDWERVMRELALVIPSDVTLTELTASAGGPAEGEAAIQTDTVLGPNLQISGCAKSHHAAGVFVAALEDIDGVTRVGLANTEKAKGAAGGAGEQCGSANTFALAVAFDNSVAAPVPAVPPSEAAPPAAAPAAGEEAPPAEPASEPAGGTNVASGVVR